MGQAVQVGTKIFSHNISNQKPSYATQHPRSPKTRTTHLSTVQHYVIYILSMPRSPAKLK